MKNIITLMLLLLTAHTAAQQLKNSMANTIPHETSLFLWSQLHGPYNAGTNGPVYAIVSSGSDVYIGGDFTTAGGIGCNRIARWDGNDFYPVGEGFNGPVHALAVYDGKIIAGGIFSQSGSNYIPYIAQWDGNTWSHLISNGAYMSNGGVYALAADANYLYAGGAFQYAGNITVSRIARWDGSEWTALGNGMNNDVWAIAVSGNNVYAGGYFTTAGGVEVDRIAHWNGENWSAIGMPPFGSASDRAVWSIAVSGGNVYAGGYIGGYYLYKWDGYYWYPVVDSYYSSVGAPVYAIKASGNDLYIGTLQTLKKFSSQTWSIVGYGGPDNGVRALAEHPAEGAMYAGGYFINVEAYTQVFYVAKFTDSDNPLPVELVSFTASVRNNEIVLKWNTATEVNNYGFEIERSATDGEWKKIGFVPGNGNSNSPKYYSFLDVSPSSERSHRYRLKQVDTDGAFSYSDVVEVTADFLPSDFVLMQNYPNPFNPETTIKFGLPEEAMVTLELYNVIGEKLATLLNNSLEAGYHTSRLSTADYGLSSGIYFLRITAQSGSRRFGDIRKLIISK